MTVPKIDKLLIFVCIIAILLTLLFRAAVHDITVPLQDDPETTQGKSSNQADDLTVFYHERRPYYVSFQDEVQGLIATPVGMIFKNASIPFGWKKTPAKRQLTLIQNNEIKACAAGWFKTPERALFGKYTLPIYRDGPLIAVTRANNTLLGETETIGRVFQEARLRLLIKVGYSYGANIDQRLTQLNPWQVFTTADNQSMLKMISNHRADYCFMTEEEAQDLLLFSGVNKSDFKLVRFTDVPQGNLRYLLCSNKVDDSTIQKLNNAIQYYIKLPDIKQ